MHMTTHYAAQPDVMQTDLGDELIVIDGRTGRSFRLNATARLAWLALPTSAEALAERLVQAFEVERNAARLDALRTLEGFVRSGLASEVASAPTTGSASEQCPEP